ncbi:MAG TPA: EF-Tu/IF-2/RF-3 family GTPase, partial [Actinomycetota bacterium]|nr:EF-Tu/IF-2/RF-3 family GTPase [Actinomycetota bacterium]
MSQRLAKIERLAKQVLGEAIQGLKDPRIGKVAGCLVTDGVIRRNARARLVREGTVVYETTISSLRRFKDDVREVGTNYECGIGLEGYQDIKEGDIIQAFETQEVARS